MCGFANHSQTEYSPNNNQNLINKNVSSMRTWLARTPLSHYLGSHESKKTQILQNDCWNILIIIAIHFNPKNHLIISEF